jgi:galactokinase
MRSVAEHLGFKRLGDTPAQAVLEHLGSLRQQLGERPILRALHYFGEIQRVALQQQALTSGDFQSFLQLVRLSGASSAQFLQNITPTGCPEHASQPLMLILALCARLLDTNSFGEDRAFPKSDTALEKELQPSGSATEFALRLPQHSQDWGLNNNTSLEIKSEDSVCRGAYRVHGGGFGGSVLAFVPKQDTGKFVFEMNTMLGYEACLLVEIGARGVYAEVLG